MFDNLKLILGISLLCSALFVGYIPSSACTDFQLKTTDVSVVCGRSMEWGQPLHSKLTFHQRGEIKNSSDLPSGKKGVQWKSKYGYVSANVYDMDVVIDGMNEKGFSFGALWLPGSTYQAVPTGAEEQAIDMLHLGSWMLGRFSSVPEALNELKAKYIWCSSIKQIGGVPTLHVALHDSAGNNAVIEFIDQKMHIYDNSNGVLTNAPTFDWHQTNLRNYIHVNASNPSPVTVAGTVLAPPGQGGGFLGIPGDWTPPSRFVRTTAMRTFAKPPADAPAAVTLAAHILNAVDIPLGAVRDAAGDQSSMDYTQWALVKDLTNRKLYYRSYNDLTLRLVDLNAVDWQTASAKKTITIDPSEQE